MKSLNVRELSAVTIVLLGRGMYMNQNHVQFKWTGISRDVSLRKKATIHQVTTMLDNSKNVLFPGHNHLLTTCTDEPTLWLSPEHKQVKGHQYQSLVGDYDLEIGPF